MKFTMGFPTDTPDKYAEKMLHEALIRNGLIPPGTEKNYTIERVETDAHKENGEFCLVVRN